MENIIALDSSGYIYVDALAMEPGTHLTLENARGNSAAVKLTPAETEKLIIALAQAAGLDVSVFAL